MTISDQLKEAIKQSGKTAFLMAQECGVPQPTITRFLQGADMKASTIDRLATYFGLQLAPVKGKASKSSQSPRSPKAKKPAR